MIIIDFASLRFERPLRCDNSGPNCVEVAHGEEGWLVRDSKTPGPVLLFTEAQWGDLTRAIANDESPTFFAWNDDTTEATLRVPGDDTALTFMADEVAAFEQGVKAGQYAATSARA